MSRVKFIFKSYRNLVQIWCIPLVNSRLPQNQNEKNYIWSNSQKRHCSTENKEQTMADVKKRLIDLMGVERGYRLLPPNRRYLLSMLPSSQEELPERSMQDSYDTALIPLSTKLNLQDKYTNILGGVRLGRLLEDMDLFAVWISLKYIVNPKQEEDKPTPYVIVTALVDHISFSDTLRKVTSDIKLHGRVTYVGKTSLEICVWLEQLHYTVWECFTKAYFVMVARDSTNTSPAFVNKLVPKGEEETLEYTKALKRVDERFQRGSTSLLKKIPNQEEQQIIHDLFMKSVDLSDPSLNRRVLPSNAVWMHDTKLSTVVFPHPEDKNHHNTVFGGLLMRLSVELAWMIGYSHSKYRPNLLYMSDVTFRKSIRVGELLRMSGQVVFTERNFFQVEVQAEIHNIKNNTLTISNTFQYTFQVPEYVTQVIPHTYHGAMMLLDGRRRYLHFLNLASEPVYRKKNT